MSAVEVVGCGVPLDAAPDPQRLTDRRRHTRIAVDVEQLIAVRRRDDWQNYINQHRKGTR